MARSNVSTSHSLQRADREPLDETAIFAPFNKTMPGKIVECLWKSIAIPTSGGTRLLYLKYSKAGFENVYNFVSRDPI